MTDDDHVEVRPVLSAAERAGAFAVRHTVFVEEQHVPVEVEIDELDEAADHLVAVTTSGDVIGTCRLLRQDDGRSVKLGRMALLKPHRKQGIAARLMRLGESRARSGGGVQMVLDAQLTAQGFYERMGYIAHGETFDSAGIQHIAMSRELTPP